MNHDLDEIKNMIKPDQKKHYILFYKFHLYFIQNLKKKEEILVVETVL